MRQFILFVFACCLSLGLTGCSESSRSDSGQKHDDQAQQETNQQAESHSVDGKTYRVTSNQLNEMQAKPAPAETARRPSASPRDFLSVQVIVALCDNENQGIVPVPAALGNGQDPKNKGAPVK